MNAFEAEELRQNTFEELSRSSSPKERLFILKRYYSLLLNDSIDFIADAFLSEYLDDFLKSAAKFEVFFSPPSVTENVLAVLNDLKKHDAISNQFDKITNIENRLHSKLLLLNEILEEKELDKFDSNKLHVPMLEKNLSPDYDLSIGSLETLTISIKKNSEINKFIIVPSSGSNDDNLMEQVNKSWRTSVEYFRKYGGKVKDFHTVIIHFDNQLGNYTGISFGAALTICFIEELIKYYNFSYLINIRKNVAVTGGFNNEGDLISITENLIIKKLEIVFYSHIKIFVVPEGNRHSLENYLIELRRTYPDRKLEIIGIKNLQDLFNRRNILDIRKQNPVKRTLRYAKKNYVVAILLLILFALSGYFYVFNFDDNPAMLKMDEYNLLVQNNSGKVLWSKKVDYDLRFPNYVLRYMTKIISLNNKKENDVLICGLDRTGIKNKKEFGSIFCFNYLGKELWHYQFKDTVKSYGENLEPIYNCILIDTITIKGKQLLVAKATNGPSFSSAIFTLDLKSGSRVGTTFWNPGFVEEGIIKRFPDDKELIIFAGNNNGYERPFIGGIQLDKLTGYAPSTHYYTFLNMKPAYLDFYLLLPETDYLKHFTVFRGGCIEQGSLYDSERENKIEFTTCEKDIDEASLNYRLDYNFKDISIIVDSNFRLERDTAVAHGLLKLPLTDTPQYCKILEDQVLYWNGKRFVKKDKL